MYVTRMGKGPHLEEHSTAQQHVQLLAARQQHSVYATLGVRKGKQGAPWLRHQVLRHDVPPFQPQSQPQPPPALLAVVQQIQKCQLGSNHLQTSNLLVRPTFDPALNL